MSAPDFSANTKNELKELNAFRCANPDCRAQTLKQKVEGGIYTVGQAAHIEGKLPGGKSARYNPRQTDKERADIANALWLCSRCHDLVDPDEKRFPARLLFRWKAMSEEFLNYSVPLFAPTNKFFFHRTKPARLGGHLVIGPSNLEAVCTGCWMEVFTSQGLFRMNADSVYENKLTIAGTAPQATEDWHPFLTAKGFDARLIFVGDVDGAKGFLAYCVGVTYLITGQSLEFRSSWNLGKLRCVREEMFQLHRVGAEALIPVLDWLASNLDTQEGKRILPILGYDHIFLRRYRWEKSIKKYDDPNLWTESNGTAIAIGNIEKGVTFAFVQEE